IVLDKTPYERQFNHWSCGAAALTMVYRSFGIQCEQEQIWEATRATSQLGLLCSRVQSLAANAIVKGLHAIAIEARDPCLVIDRCLSQSVLVIINHTPEAASGSGHFSVLTALNEESATLHDPNWGPNRILTRKELLQLWNPRSPSKQIPDQVMIAIAERPSHLDACALCRGQAHDSVICKCGREVVLQPLAILGCLTDWCPLRAWERVFCPWCEHSWTKGL